MNLIESMRIAVRSLLANKLRTVLTMLGISIGVGTVITLVAIGRGTQSEIVASLKQNGTNLLYVHPSASRTGLVRGRPGSASTLTLEDANALKDAELAPAVVAVAPEVASFGQVVYQGHNSFVRVGGVTPNYTEVRNTRVINGSWFNESHLATRATVCVLGPETVKNVFGGADPLGQTIKINGIPFRVMGVTAAKGGTGFGSQDDVVFIPLTTANARLQGGARFRGQLVISTISVQVADASLIQAATAQIGNILRERHKVAWGNEDFTINNPADIVQSLTQISNTMALFLGSIAAISLVVGGIGIMNIMLVSVVERTREIGIRKAMGAQKEDILLQFLAEALAVSLIGGLAGVVGGWGVVLLVSGVDLGNGVIHAVVELDAVLLATICAAAIGLFFGIYPANRAANLNPIEALRYE